MKHKFIVCIFLILNVIPAWASKPSTTIQPGATQLNRYLPLLQNKRVAVFANQTSMIGNKHLVDVLIQHDINVIKIFTPEHGFRGNAADGEKVHDEIDDKTGVRIVSLYGKRTKPNADDLADVDIIVFDIQDVGVRFYTYISSLQRLMEGAIQYDKPLIVLDRPNPNGFYVDGPVLNLKNKSFAGLQPIPVVYGMTIGEYAKMLVGEHWLNVDPKSDAHLLRLTVIPCVNYTHKSLYVPPVKPSPNLPDIQSIYWYPTIGMMEATVMSVGRGTSTPFQVFGSPSIRSKQYSFIPKSRPGAEDPPYKNRICYGWCLIGNQSQTLRKINKKLQIKYVMQAFNAFPDKDRFFQGFASMVGIGSVEKQIKAGWSETDIRKSWQPELNQFKAIRKKYLLYPDYY